ncbi:MAG TPA: hypothetical protein RMH99_20780, partial [Sandaracinaceae bacterium LLY-WYZ-13_1]|nr:hypothetical protein [Sandaracinaceae bacterium LLY-WYZ-13_1]
ACRTAVAGPIGDLPASPPFAVGVGVAEGRAVARERARTAALTDTLLAATEGAARARRSPDPADRARHAAMAVAAGLTALGTARFFEDGWTTCVADPGALTAPTLPDDCPPVAPVELEEPPGVAGASAGACDRILTRGAARVRQALEAANDPSAAGALAADGLARQLGCARRCRRAEPPRGWPSRETPCATEASARETLRAGLAEGDPGAVLRCLAPGLQQAVIEELVDPERSDVEVLDGLEERLDAARIEAREQDGAWRLAPRR